MKIISIAISKKKGTRKSQIDHATLIQNHGLEGDAHAGSWHRQVSFLASESIEASKKRVVTLPLGIMLKTLPHRELTGKRCLWVP